jgi:hypothetical protein
MIDMLLSADRTYQDFAKPGFCKASIYQEAGSALEVFKKAGDTYLNRYQGHCNTDLCEIVWKGYLVSDSLSIIIKN